MPYFQVVSPASYWDGYTDPPAAAHGSCVIVNRRAFPTLAYAVKAIDDDQGYPRVDMCVVEAAASREVSAVFRSGDATRCTLVPKGAS